MLLALGVAATDIADVTEAVLSGADYQRDFPGPTPEPQPPPEWWRDFLEWLSGSGGIAEIALWVFGAGLVIWVILQLVQLRGPGPAPAGDEPAPDILRARAVPVVRPGGEAATLASADTLAAERRYGEAIHALLLHCVGEIKRRPGTVVADSLTAREIARRPDFSGDVRSALWRLVSGAERSHFGGYPAAEDDYRTCRQDYLQVVATMAPA
jgi:hypothetical protein